MRSLLQLLHQPTFGGAKVTSASLWCDADQSIRFDGGGGGAEWSRSRVRRRENRSASFMLQIIEWKTEIICANKIIMAAEAAAVAATRLGRRRHQQVVAATEIETRLASVASP